ncbi:hypothetical protein EW026_g5385 [Hermanssonia centrifuga]|uniref:Uncharacterized protein n=1 Tax=Hermanssonia centrifuga TaxID=98765 RepID=A0A4S4KFA3_9APHY|nr:hypothetical protein EW026_g5385 [Hermanssonia centrifuga]
MPAMLLPELPQNQCVFLSAYRLKYRIPKIWRTVAAAAGYDQLPDADDSDRHDPSATNDSMEREVETEGGPPTFRGPCDILLDYILNNSTAHAAVASEASLNDLLAGKEWPDDLETFLNELCPAIEIDENGYGTLSFEEEIRRTRIRETDYVPDDLDDRAIMRMHEACDSSDRQVLENGKLFLDGSSKPVTWSHIILANNQAEMGSVSAVAVSSQGHHVATGTEDGVVRIWNYKSGKVEVRLEGHEEQVCSLAFSPDGTHIASGSGDFHGMIWDLNDDDDDDDYAPLHVLEGHDGDVCAITYSPSGTLVATGSMDYTARVWKASDGAHLFTLGRPHTASVLLATFSPDETYLLTCSNNMGYVWDPYSGSLLRTLQGHTDAIWSMSLSPDGQRVVTGSEDLTGRVWSVETGDELVTLREHTGGVWSVGFSPDGKDVVTGSYDSTIVTCDSYTGERRHIFQERPAIVNAVAYSYSGDFIASGSADGCVKVWDTSSGAFFVAEFQGHRDKVKSVAWTRDDLNIISSSDDGSVRTWNMRDMLRLV